MKDFDLKLKKYAEVIIKFGVNLQKDEYVVINADIYNAPLVRALSVEAYQNGAKRVIISWRDEEMSKINYKYATADALCDLFGWEVESRNFIADVKACYINITSNDPDMFKSIDGEKLAKVNKATRTLNKKFHDATMSNDVKWCIVGAPSPKWADKIFPNDENAVEKLWELIFHSNRIDTENPLEAWEKHTLTLAKRCKALNDLKLDRVEYKSSNGTNLTVKLPDNYIFLGGTENSTAGCPFAANMPTEEVFSAPHKYGVNGKLVATLPLSSRGKIINNFGFTFENGKVVDFYADEGYDTLKSILESDSTSCYLGEIALISYDSPINNTKTLFYNTLFDENASCHFALGAAYPSTVLGGLEMSEEELEANGINDSFTHVDFMVGARDLSIIGYTKDGNKVNIMLNGNLLL